MLFIEYVKGIQQLAKEAYKCSLVLGNSSADYDSVMGSLLYSYFLTRTQESAHFPLVDCPERDIKLRFETNQILNKSNIKASDLLYSQSFLAGKQQSQTHKFILYDHNVRKELSGEIESIVDHHFFEKEKLQTNRYLIHPVGSALTMIYYIYNPHKLLKIEENPTTREQCKQSNQSLLSEKLKQFWQIESLEPKLSEYDIKVDELIRYGILIDVFGFDTNQKDRWTQYDLFAVQQIESRGQKEGIKWMNYDDLSKIKYDQKQNLSLTIEEHMRKDYKEFLYEYSQSNKPDRKTCKAFYSIISLKPQTFLAHYDKQGGISTGVQQKFQLAQKGNNKHQSMIYFFMFVYEQGNSVKRDMICFTHNQELRKQVNKVIADLKMERKEIVDRKEWDRWHDLTSTISRKKFDKIMSTKL